MMRLAITRLLTLSATVLIAATTPSLAQQSDVELVALSVEENAEERINYSGKLRMLSQRIPAAACHLSQGIDVESARALLEAAPKEFEKILTALEFGGDAELNIKNPETRPKTLLRIQELRTQWEPLKAAANKISEGTATDEDIIFVLTNNMPVLEAAVRLVPELVKQYSNPNAVPYADLLLIDISGRQRMLTQKMSKESCIMATQLGTPETANDLEQTAHVFEASLDALRFGLPHLSLKAPPNTTISEGLSVVLQDWNSVKPLLTSLLNDEQLENSEKALKFQRLNMTMANMNKVVGMYTQATKPAG